MFGRSIVALITPFTKEEQLDQVALKSLIDWHIEVGTDALVLAGSTGEGSSLSFEEKLRVFTIASQVGRGKIGLIANTGTNTTRDSLDLTEKAKELEMDGCLAVVPYYNKPEPEGIIAHFHKIAEMGLPVILYHHPGRTGTRLSLDTIGAICSHSNVVAIKDAAGDLALSFQTLKKASVAHYSGDDGLILSQMSQGFTGSISVVGNLIPSEWKQFLERPGHDGFEKFSQLIKTLGLETNPQCVKYALSLMGKCEPIFRLPLIAPKESTRLAIESALASTVELPKAFSSAP